MFLGISRAKIYHVLAFPAGEGADQRMRREADEGYATPPLPSDSRPLKPKFEFYAFFRAPTDQNISTAHSAISRHPASPPKGRKQGRKNLSI